MGLFSRRRETDPDEALAQAIGERGVGATATIENVWATGESKEGGAAQRLELTLSFTTRDGAPVRATVRQWFNKVTMAGMEAGREAEIMYDRDAPATVVVLGPASG
jgi:hypothetical protein